MTTTISTHTPYLVPWGRNRIDKAYAYSDMALAKVSGNWQNKFKDFAITNMILFGSHNLFGMNTELGSRATNLIVNEDNSSRGTYEKELPGGFISCCDWKCSAICNNTCKSGWFWTILVGGIAVLGTGAGLTAYFLTRDKGTPSPTPGPTPVSVTCNDISSNCPYYLLKRSLKSTLQKYNLKDRVDFCFGQMSPDEDKYGFIFNGNKYCTLYTSLIDYGDEEPLFFDKDINSIDVIKLPKNCNSTAYMFVGADKVNSINLENIDTANITNTTGMFMGTASLASINGFDKLNFTSVIDTTYMFAFSNLMSIDLTGFEKSKVKIANGMFWGNNEFENDETLTITNLGYIGKNSLESAELMFSDSKMTDDIVTAIKAMDTSNLVNVSYMFSSIDANTINLDLSGWRTDKIKNAEGMFSSSKLNTVKLAESTSLENAESMFQYACFLNGIDGLANLKFTNLNNVKSMFEDYGVCEGETTNSVDRTLDLSKLDTSNIKSAERMFSGSKLASLTLNNFDKLENATMMFKDANIDAFTFGDDFELSSFKCADSMFENFKCPTVEGSSTLDLSDLGLLSTLSSAKKMFFGSECKVYTVKGFSNKLISMEEMFAESQATTITLDNCKTSDTLVTKDAFKVAASPTTSDSREEDEEEENGDENAKRDVTVKFEFTDNKKIKEELADVCKFTCEAAKTDTELDTCTKTGV